MTPNERVYQSVFINLFCITNLLQDYSAEFVIFTSIHPCSLGQELVNGQTNLTEAINGEILLRVHALVFSSKHISVVFVPNAGIKHINISVDELIAVLSTISLKAFRKRIAASAKIVAIRIHKTVGIEKSIQELVTIESALERACIRL